MTNETNHTEKTLSTTQHAQELFNEFYASCFWHMKPDLIMTEAMIPWIVKEFCAHGGRRGMLAAATLQEKEES